MHVCMLVHIILHIETEHVFCGTMHITTQDSNANAVEFPKAYSLR